MRLSETVRQALQHRFASTARSTTRLPTRIRQISTTALRSYSQKPAMVDLESGRGGAPQCPTTTGESGKSPSETPLPKLSAADFRVYNKMAEHMDYFHNHFRATWKLLMDACESNKRPKNMSIRQFLGTGLQLCQHLTMHHTIEEQHIFPVLAKKMPAFQKELELLSQHKQIHKGLDKLEDYLEKCRSGEKELRLNELKEVLDGFGEVLWQHLDDEVKQLGAENMRKYWSLEEMKRMPM